METTMNPQSDAPIKQQQPEARIATNYERPTQKGAGEFSKPITAAIIGTAVLAGIIIVYKLWFEKSEPEDNRVPDASVVKEFPPGSRFCINGVWYQTTRTETVINDWWMGTGLRSVGRFFFKIANYDINGSKYSLRNLASSEVSKVGTLKMRIPYMPRVEWREDKKQSVLAWPDQMQGCPYFETIKIEFKPIQVIVLEHLEFIPKNRKEWRLHASERRVTQDVSIIWDVWLKNDNPKVPTSWCPSSLKIMSMQTAYNDVDWYTPTGAACGGAYLYKNRMRRIRKAITHELKKLIENTTSDSDVPFSDGSTPLWVRTQPWPIGSVEWKRAREVFSQYYSSVFFGHGIQCLLDGTVSSPVIRLESMEIPNTPKLGDTEETENDEDSTGNAGPEFSLNVNYEEYPEGASAEIKEAIDARNRTRALEKIFASYSWVPNPAAEIYYRIHSTKVNEYMLNCAYWGAFISGIINRAEDASNPVSTHIMSYKPDEQRFLSSLNGIRYTQLYPGALIYYDNLRAKSPWCLASYGYQSESGDLIPPILTGSENEMSGADTERRRNGDAIWLNDHFITQPIESRLLIKADGISISQADTDSHQ